MRNLFIALLFMAPSLLVFISFVFVPLIKTFILSFQLTNPIGLAVGFAGLDNYDRVFTNPELPNSLRVSFLYALYLVPTAIVVSLFLATLGNFRLRGITLFRVIFSSTIAVSGATASLIFLFIYNPLNGTLNYLLDVLNLPRVQWLINDSSALVALAIVSIWLQLGFNTVILLAAMQGVSQELYESATLDGAGGWAQFRHITIPMISPTIFFLLVVDTLAALQTFTQINILTRGGPINSTTTIVYLIYQSFYIQNQYGIAGALSVILFFLMLVLTVIQFGVLERRVYYA